MREKAVLIVRAEIPEDFPAVRRVNELAFGRPDEAALVEALRATDPHISLVATRDEQVVGHIFFSPVSFEAAGPDASAMGLAPMAVLPEFQQRGIGSRLVRAGLEECRRIGIGAVVVLGHAGYYPRFGFVPACQYGLRCKWPAPDEFFMVTELKPGALDGMRGLVEYRTEFDGV